MEILSYLNSQLDAHPSMQPQDVIKLCYQAAFGAEHILNDTAAARAYFDEEFRDAPANGDALCEAISPEVCRVSLPAWRSSGMPAEWLFKMFAASACASPNGEERFRQYLAEAQKLPHARLTAYSAEQWEGYIAFYTASGVAPVHHSETYRANERPSYRIVSRRVARLLPILERAAVLSGREPRIIAIDGRAASGKTTMADQLAKVIGGAVVHMDDFFLPPDMRLPDRLAQPGGNVHYERFVDEVLPHIANPEAFSYRIFDCERSAYNGRRTVGGAAWRIVEGAYSRHPAFGEYADLTAYADVEPDVQQARIVERNGEEMAAMFRDRWIPLEERYFSACAVRERADCVI